MSEDRLSPRSERFGYSSEFIYLICAVQVACSIGVLVRPLASWAAAALTVITLGAVASHLKIGSPLTTIPALLYPAVQVWLGFERWPRTGEPGVT